MHDPRRYQNRQLVSEIQRYHSKTERRLARKMNQQDPKQKNIKIKDMPYQNKFNIDKWVDEYWLMHCSQDYSVQKVHQAV